MDLNRTNRKCQEMCRLVSTHAFGNCSFNTVAYRYPKWGIFRHIPWALGNLIFCFCLSFWDKKGPCHFYYCESTSHVHLRTMSSVLLVFTGRTRAPWYHSYAYYLKSLTRGTLLCVKILFCFFHSQQIQR